MSWDYKQALYCLQEVWHSLIKWVRGESQKQRALTTCDRHLNSFQHDISLNQAYKRLHCTADVDWAEQGWLCRLKFSFLHQWKWSTKQIPSWDNYSGWGTRWVNSIMVKQRQCIGSVCLMDENYIQAKIIKSYKQRENSTTGCQTVSCYYHNCLGLSVWSNQSTGLKILHKGEPALSFLHPLWETTSIVRSGYCLFYWEVTGRKEVQSRGGGDVQTKAGNTLQTGRILRVQSTRPRKQHTLAQMHRNTSTLHM